MDEKQSVSDLLDVIIGESSQAFHSYDYKEVNEFEELLSLGELVDRLTIVNINYTSSKMTLWYLKTIASSRGRQNKTYTWLWKERD